MGWREGWRDAGRDGDRQESIPLTKSIIHRVSHGRAGPGVETPTAGGTCPPSSLRLPSLSQLYAEGNLPPGGGRCGHILPPFPQHRSPSTGSSQRANESRLRTLPQREREEGGRGAERPYPSCCRVLAGFIASRWGGGFLAFLSFIFGVCERLRSLARRRWVGGGMGRGRPCGGGGWQKC